jgi:hypothetical protein
VANHAAGGLNHLGTSPSVTCLPDMASCPPQLKALVSALPHLVDDALLLALRTVAMRVLGRPSPDSRELSALLTESGITGAHGNRDFLGACEFLLRQANKPQVTVDKMSGRLIPLGFTAEHLKTLADTKSWIEDGAMMPLSRGSLAAAGGSVSEPEPEDMGGADYEAMIAGLAEEFEVSSSEEEDEASSSDDDDDGGDGAGSGGEEEEQGGLGSTEGDDGAAVDLTKYKVLQTKLPLAEAMHTMSALSDENLHRLLRAALKHKLKYNMAQAELDKLEQIAREESIAADKLPSILQHLVATLARAGAGAAAAEGEHDYAHLRLALGQEQWGPFSAAQQDIVCGAADRWSRQLRERRSATEAAVRTARQTELHMDGWLLKRGDVNTELRRRWFTLRGGNVSYYRSRGGKKAGSFRVGGARLSLIDGGNDESTSGSGLQLINVELPGRTYVIQGESEGQQDAWLAILTEASTRYQLDSTVAGGVDADVFEEGSGGLGSRADFTGWMEKQGEKNKEFKRRWFVLHGVTLSYYKNEEAAAVKKRAGLFHIGGAELVPDESAADGLTVRVVLPHRTYVLRCESQADLEVWTGAFHAAQQGGGGTGSRSQEEDPQAATPTTAATEPEPEQSSPSATAASATAVAAGDVTAGDDDGAGCADVAATVPEEGVPPEPTDAGAGQTPGPVAGADAAGAGKLDIYSKLPSALTQAELEASQQRFSALEIVKRRGEVDEEREVSLCTSALGLVIADADDPDVVLDFVPIACVLRMDNKGVLNQGKLKALRVLVIPRCCTEKSRVAAAVGEKAQGEATAQQQQQQRTLYFALKDPAPLAKALTDSKANAKRAAQTQAAPRDLEVCVDAATRKYWAEHVGSRDFAFKEGMVEKLGEGGLRKRLGKKWQWRLFSLNEETLAWYVKNAAGSGADESSLGLAGSISVCDIEKVWATAGASKGRADSRCLQIEGRKLPHSYTLAAPTQQERDFWVLALRRMAAAHTAQDGQTHDVFVQEE